MERMPASFEERFKSGYEEYLKLPKEDRMENRNSDLYTNGWCVLTGRAIIHPHPHRHFSFLEFVYYCGKDQTLFDKFIK